MAHSEARMQALKSLYWRLRTKFTLYAYIVLLGKRKKVVWIEWYEFDFLQYVSLCVCVEKAWKEDTDWPEESLYMGHPVPKRALW